MPFLSASILRITMKTYRLSCEILSPIHIGSGKEIDPLNYIIKGERLYKISFEKFVMGINDAERLKLEELIDRGDLLLIREYVADHIDIHGQAFYSIAVNPRVIDIYNSKKGDIQNQLLISPFIRTDRDVKPLMPGSSIKGAIRTAVISEFAKKKNLPEPRNSKEEYAFESKVLGYKDAKNDPFRGVKIRDKSLENNSTVIREIRNVSKGDQGALKTNEIQMIYEITHSTITGNPVGFQTEIIFDETLFLTGFLGINLNEEQIVKSCTDFYTDKMKNEHAKFYQHTEVERYSKYLLDASFDKNSFPLRIGRFSGVESVTLDRFRNPKPPGKKKTWGNTRNLAGGIYPMGWMKVTLS
jgi:CRISPR-associated protein Csm5